MTPEEAQTEWNKLISTLRSQKSNENILIEYLCKYGQNQFVSNYNVKASIHQTHRNLVQFSYGQTGKAVLPLSLLMLLDCLRPASVGPSRAGNSSFRTLFSSVPAFTFLG